MKNSKSLYKKNSMSAMNLASIDIGSNGARLLIKRFEPEAIREEDRIKKLMFIRIPLRLGKDVFTLEIGRAHV